MRLRGVHQTNMINQFRAYFILKNRNPEWLKDYEGFCYGYSIVWSVLDEFERMLSAIDGWDQRTDPQWIKTSFKKFDGTNKTLEDIFEEVIQYVVFNSADSISGIDNLVQSQFLKTNTTTLSFEINVIEKGHRVIKKIKDSEVLSGYFRPQFLKDFFWINKGVIARHICLVIGLGHACALKYNNAGFWYYYNSNCFIGKQIFLKIDDLVKVIELDLGLSLCIEFASFQEENLSIIGCGRVLLDFVDMSIIDGAGLHIILDYQPHLFPLILESVRYNDLGPQKFAQALMCSDYGNRTGLWKVLTRAPQYFFRVLLLVGKNVMLYALGLFNKNKKTNLHLLVKNLEVDIPEIFQSLLESDGNYYYMGYLLKLPDENGKSPLQLIDEYRPDFFQKAYAISLAENCYATQLSGLLSSQLSLIGKEQYREIVRWRYALYFTVQELYEYVTWLGIPPSQRSVLFDMCHFSLLLWVYKLETLMDLVRFILFFNIHFDETQSFFEKHDVNLALWWVSSFYKPNFFKEFEEIIYDPGDQGRIYLSLFKPSIRQNSRAIVAESECVKDQNNQYKKILRQ